MEHTKLIAPKEVQNKIYFYFSFLSPYAWLAFYRLSKIGEFLPVEINYIPIFPASAIQTINPKKTAYVTKDIERFDNAYGLTLHWPKLFDTDWKRPHTIFLYALDQGLPIKFARLSQLFNCIFGMEKHFAWF